MKHQATQKFWKHYQALPSNIQKLADKNYELLKNNAFHPSLQFKKVDPVRRRWSVRVGDHYRALSVELPEGFLWVWVGTHAEYDGLLK